MKSQFQHQPNMVDHVAPLKTLVDMYHWFQGNTRPVQTIVTKINSKQVFSSQQSPCGSLSTDDQRSGLSDFSIWPRKWAIKGREHAVFVFLRKLRRAFSL